MTKDEIFIGPIIRRAEPSLVVIQIALKKIYKLKFSCRRKYTEDWIGHDIKPIVIKVFENLHFCYGLIKPDKGKRFPTGKILEYSIAVINENGEEADYSFFESIVKEEVITYNGHKLPSFLLQDNRSRLTALYGSCRKFHDVKGGKKDALTYADDVVHTYVDDVRKRPVALCLGGDQIYADDVDPVVLQECIDLSAKLAGIEKEKIPGVEKVPEPGRRQGFVNQIGFSSDAAENHLIYFGEYIAMYGLAWNNRNWKQDSTDLTEFRITLPKVRRLLANIPTYMIFDDHDVTDDWNLCIEWILKVYARKIGRRIIANALAAYWLCQGFGNDPFRYSKNEIDTIIAAFESPNQKFESIQKLFYDEGSLFKDKWEFSTPTVPFIYFIDTRTMRGHRDLLGSSTKVPAFLKRIEAWNSTVKKITERLGQQSNNVPIVLVTTGPVLSFETIDQAQASLSLTGRKWDMEGWAANPEHLNIFLQILHDRQIVILSGDVHYSFTSTASFITMDSSVRIDRLNLRKLPALTLHSAGLGNSYLPLYTAKILQLNSSALKNYANDLLEFLAAFNVLRGGYFITEDLKWVIGELKGNDCYVFEQLNNQIPGIFKKTDVNKLKPIAFLKQQINDDFNSHYNGDHNVGLLTINGLEVSNTFYTPNGQSEKRTWNFSNDVYWK